MRIGNDPNMLIRGAYPDREDKAIGMHNKYGFGFEWESVRIGMDVESFSAIGFTKWTYLYADYKVASGIRNITLFGGLEMSQNAMKLNWTKDEVDAKLHQIMSSIHAACLKYGTQDDGYINYVKGANIAGFIKVADSMLDLGVV